MTRCSNQPDAKSLYPYEPDGQVMRTTAWGTKVFRWLAVLVVIDLNRLLGSSLCNMGWVDRVAMIFLVLEADWAKRCSLSLQRAGTDPNQTEVVRMDSMMDV
jgi:hypothetical protein